MPVPRVAWLRGWPVLLGVLPIRRSQVAGDVLAGVTLAALAIPEVLGYARIAGMPVVTGLYTLLLPMAVFAVLGSSRHLVVRADSATAAILAAALTGLAVPGSPRYVQLAGLAALLTGGMLLLARAVRRIRPRTAPVRRLRPTQAEHIPDGPRGARWLDRRIMRRLRVWLLDRTENPWPRLPSSVPAGPTAASGCGSWRRPGARRCRPRCREPARQCLGSWCSRR